MTHTRWFANVRRLMSAYVEDRTGLVFAAWTLSARLWNAESFGVEDVVVCFSGLPYASASALILAHPHAVIDKAVSLGWLTPY